MKHLPKHRYPREFRLGVDIGRVIIAGDGPDTSFIGGTDAQAMKAPAMDGAFDALRRLTALLDGRVWLVSKCGPRIQERSRSWLSTHRFFERTTIPRENLRFCRERREKAPICAALELSAFIDDRQDVLTSMIGIVPTLLMFGSDTSPLAGILPAPDWDVAEREIVAAINRSTEAAPGAPAEHAR